MLQVSKRSKRLFAILVGFMMVVSQSSYLSLNKVYAETNDSGSTETVYMLTDTLKAGQDYVIASGDSGSVSIFENDSDAIAFGKTEVISDDNGSYIKAISKDAIWTAQQDNVLVNGDNSVELEKNSGDSPAYVVLTEESEATDNGEEVYLYVESEINTSQDGDVDSTRGPPEEVTALEEEATEEPATKASNDTVLTFTSDAHNRSGNDAGIRIGKWLGNVEDMYGKKADVMAFGGDMGVASWGGNSSDYWSYTQADMDAVENAGVSGVYTTGNHEYQMGGDFSYSSYTDGSYSSNGTEGQFKINTEGSEGAYYRIYCLGSVSSSNSYSSQYSLLEDYLDNVGNDKPIFIITHFPLHKHGSRSTSGAKNTINVLNAAVENGKTIIFLWGHNHTESDPYYDQIYGPGTTLPTADGDQTIQFYYGGAGCMSDSENGTGSAYVKGKGLAVAITPNGKNSTINLAYYNEAGSDVTENNSIRTIEFTGGEAVAIESISIDGAARQTVEKGKTLKLSYTKVPSNATVNSITWESSNPEVASVDEKGKVTGLAESGTTTITATVSDGINRGTASASVEIEAIPRDVNGKMYVLTDTLAPDKNYIIANKNSGSCYAMTNNSGSVGLTTVEVDDETIVLEDEEAAENIAFTTGGSGTTVSSIGNNGRYLSAGNSSLTLATSAPSNRTFAYGSDNKLTVSSGSSTYYIYYSTYNGGRYSASTSATSSSSPREVYLYEEVTEQIDATGVTVTPAESTVLERQTVQLTATVEPENATNKKVTWSSSDTSIAKVDTNGKVRGIAEGTATITATTANGKQGTATVHVDPNPSTETHYVIVSEGHALSVNRSPNTAYGGSNSYTYTGLVGVAYESGDAADDSIRWVIEETEGGYYIKDLDGNYLNATYTSGTNSGTGDLKLDNTPDVWVLDEGYSLEGGTVDGSKLKSTNASNTASSEKFLAYEDSATLFSVRSSGNADNITITEASDPVAVESVSIDPSEASILTRNTVQLTATVLPENATNKKVTWSSSNTSVATVDENGKVKGIAEGDAVITATADGKTATAAIHVDPNPSTEPTYVITVGSFALSTDTTTDQLSNNNGAYIYTGLAGAAFDPSETPEDNIRWIFEETDGGFYIKSLDGRYLNATYTAASNPSASNPTRGVLKLDNTPDVWVLDDGVTLDSWEVDGSYLKSTNASSTAPSDKFLAYEEGTSSNRLNLFTVRSKDNADETTLVDPSATIIERFVETDSLQDGKEYIIAVTKDDESAYAVKNITGTSTGNTGSVTLTVVPSSGSNPAYIETEDTGVVWKYASSNSYMTNSGNYLGYESSTYLPRTSSQGRAITYSNKKLSIGTNHYLTCDSSGTFGTNTSSSSGATVRLFVKTIEIITCDHTYGDPEWTWTGDDENGYTAATAKFTCTKCGEVQTVKATVEEEPSNETIVYTATAVFGGETYTDTKTVVHTHTWGEPTYEWAADNSTCTATRVCTKYSSHVETETVNTKSAVKDPTCEEAGYTTFTATFENEAFEEQTKKVDGEAATGHEYGEPAYEWAADNSTCTATRVCANDSTHVDTETVNTESEVTDPTCTEAGYTTYTAAFTNEAFGTKTKKVDGEAATGHDWAFVDFTWTGDQTNGYTKAVANYKCTKNDATDTVEAELDITTEGASCSAPGTVTYTATVSADASLDGIAKSEVKTISVEELGHLWKFVDFTWAADFSTATANYKCDRDPSHTDTLNVTASVDITPVTCEVDGSTVFTVTVSAEDSLDKTEHSDSKTVPGATATGHAYGAPTYVWADDNSSCTATRVCANDATHVETETAEATSEVTDPTCTEAGFTTFTVIFKNEAFGTKTKKVDGEAATGHEWGEPAYEWAADNSTCTATVVCTKDATHVETETAEATSEVTKDPTETEAGEMTYTAEFENELFETQTVKEEIPALQNDDVLRISGETRFKTSMRIADYYMDKINDGAKFRSVVIATGTNFPDALAGSYFANQNDAPIIMIDESSASEVVSYVNENIADTGTVYVLGGEGAVPEAWLDDLNKGIKRVKGDTRYDTNINILKKADVEGGDIFVCTGTGFADALSGSGLDMPILLVGSGLTDSQKAFLENGDGWRFHIIGGTLAVDTATATELRSYGTVVTRISGDDRYDTSEQLAEEYAGDVDQMILATGKNFPDGLCGGPVAYNLGAPIILTDPGSSTHGEGYADTHSIKKGIVLGGTLAIDDPTVRKVFQMDDADEIPVY